MVAVAWLIAGTILVLGATQDQVLGMIICLPVIASAWVYAFRGAALASLVCLPFTTLCLALGGMDAIHQVRTDMFIPIGHAVAVIVAFLFGYLQSLRTRLVAETQLRVVTERAKAQAELEAQLLRADRLTTLGTMAAGIAHEVNNPLTFVLGNLELARDELAAREAQPDSATWARLREGLLSDLDEARIGAERIQGIVGELKLFMRERKSSEQTEVELGEVLDTAIMLTRHELGPDIELVKEFEPAPAVHGDAGKLGQIFINLLVNAAQAMSSKGQGRIIITLGQSSSTDEVVATVSDNGSGMSAAVKARAFDPFFTTKPVGVGTGLGLALCADIVRDHGGTIELDSEPGAGTTFRLCFPLAQRA